MALSFPRGQSSVVARRGDPVHVLIVDSHPGVRSGVAAVLAGATGLDVVGEADGWKAAIAFAHALEPDVVLLDVSVTTFPDGNASVVGLLRALPRAAAVVLFSVLPDQAGLRAAIAAGATGYVLKDAPPLELVGTLRDAARNRGPSSSIRHDHDLDEPELVHLAAGGDPNAWEQLYRRTYPTVMALAAQRLPPAEAAEAAAATFLRALAALDRLDRRGGAFAPWLVRIADHVIAGEDHGPNAFRCGGEHFEPSAVDLAIQRRAALDRQHRTDRRSSPLRTRVAIAATAALVVGGASTAAAAANRLPAPIEAAATALGLHDEPTGLDRATETLDRLRDALARGDVAAAQQAAAELRSRLDTLPPGDRSRIEADATALLQMTVPPVTAQPDDRDDVGSASTGDDSTEGSRGTDGDQSGPSPSGGHDGTGSTDDHGGGSGGSGPSGPGSIGGIDDGGGGHDQPAPSTTPPPAVANTASSTRDGGDGDRHGDRGGPGGGSDSGSSSDGGSGHGG